MKLGIAIVISAFAVKLAITSAIHSDRNLTISTTSESESGIENIDIVTTANPMQVHRRRLKFDRASSFEITEKIPTDKVREATNAVKIFIAETIYGINNIVEKFYTGLYNTAKAFASDTLELIVKARDNVMEVIRIVATKILEIEDEKVKEFFENVKEVLEQVHTFFIDLLGQAEKEFNTVLNHVNNTLMSISEDLEEWSNGIKMKLKSIKDDEVYKRACDLIDDFVNSSVEEAYECCNIAVKPMKSICKNAKDVIGDTLSILVDIIEKVEVCIFEKKARVPVMIACLDDAYDKVEELIKHASDLKDSLFKTLPSKIMISNFCFSVAAVSVEVRKIEIAGEINKKYLS